MSKSRFASSVRTVFHSQLGSSVFGVAFTAICGLLFAELAINALSDYGWVLFLGVPFFCGFNSVFLFSFREERSLGGCLAVSSLSIVLLGALITCFALDGMVCILMAAPLAFVVSIPGALCGRAAGRHFGDRKRSPIPPVVTMLLLLPLLMGFDSKLELQPPLRKVVTHVDIAASPEAIWKCVVAFPPIPEPDDLIFKAGIAYPLNAQIKGTGVGAIRYCNFSTGPFVEPIRVWNERHLLKFDVVKNPSPLKELSFYHDLQTAHLQNFMISKAGQFKLTRLNATTTRLEGMTWYYHRLWPSAYWGVISDAIIHKIHLRVLNHIKAQVERG